MSSRRAYESRFAKTAAWSSTWAALALLGVASSVAGAQYPGRITNKTQNAPELRAVAVLEWTGEPGKPKACRIVPVSIYDGERLNDAGVYMARPAPLALSAAVEYQLKRDGKTIGLFDVTSAGQQQGSWVGFGKWKALPKPKPEALPKAVDVDDASDDKPVLHRKHHADDSSAGGAGNNTAAQDDPDRPKLHKKDDSAGSEPPPDPDRPTLHRSPGASGSGAPGDAASDGGAAPDPDRPVLRKPKAEKPADDVAHSDTTEGFTDPDRPRLQRGKGNPADTMQVPPSMMGLPENMQQAVAVSDAQNRPDHPWTFSWANPSDEEKLKAQLEDTARTALGLNAPPAPAQPTKVASHRTGTAAKKARLAAPPAEPAELHDEQFRVFELAYGAGATLVLSANTGGPLAEEKFVTLVAQPDIYGNLQVLLKYVTDGAHLDEAPVMRLVDAVDAMADNRGELLFELRGQTSRQFALYRVLRGRADKLFVSGGGFYGTPDSE